MYFDAEQLLAIQEEQFIQEATERRVDSSLLQDFIHCFTASKHAHTHKVVLVDKAIALLRRRPYPVSQADLSEILRLSSLKFSGTDGVRGVVDCTTAYTEGQSVQAFLRHKTITPTLCGLLASGFGAMLREHAPTLVRTVAIAEDGRDSSEGTGLVSCIATALQNEGFAVELLGVVPTPALAAWSLDRRCGSIMVTASHNPHQYNGMKFFIEGRKLFPEGSCGEFALSSYALENMGTGKTRRVSSPSVVAKGEEARSLFASLFETSLSEKEKSVLRGCHFVIDCANGAASYMLPSLLHDLGFSFHLVAQKPAKKAINKDCGAALLEGMYSVSSELDSVSPLLSALFALGHTYEHRRVFGIALDGDGDRGLLVVPTSDGRSVTILHGDELLLLLSRRSIGTKGTIRVTLESDDCIRASLQALSADFTIEMTGVGDRHLSAVASSTVLAGGEDSGHLVFPIPVGSGTLYSGNGLLSALVGISVLVGDKLTLPLFVRKGVDKRSVPLKDTSLWFSHSTLWDEVEGAIARHFSENLVAARFVGEPDMLAYRTEADDLLYVRASGTEPKLNVSFSRIGDTGFTMLVQSLQGICATM